MSDRRSEAVWDDARQRWDCRVSKNGTRRHFLSSIKGRKGKHDAENKADEWLESGTKKMQAAQAWDTYIEDIKLNKSTAIYTQAERLGRLYIRPNLAHKRLSDVTPAHWQACINSGCKAGLSRRSCVNIRANIVAFLKYARLHRWEYDRIENGDLIIPYSAPAPKQKRVLNDTELSIVFSDPTIIHYGRPKICHYIHAYRFLILTGLRRGELCGLRQSDIVGNTLTVSRSINTHNEITQGKTDNARRTFILTPSMLEVLAEQRAYLASVNISSPWLFPDTYGETPNANQLYDHWMTYRKQHNIACSLHELRHTFISLTKSDLPMELLKAQVGHSTTMDTSLIYAHEVTGDKERAASIIESILTNHIHSSNQMDT